MLASGGHHEHPIQLCTFSIGEAIGPQEHAGKIWCIILIAFLCCVGWHHECWAVAYCGSSGQFPQPGWHNQKWDSQLTHLMPQLKFESWHAYLLVDMHEDSQSAAAAAAPSQGLRVLQHSPCKRIRTSLDSHSLCISRSWNYVNRPSASLLKHSHPS